MTTAIAQFNNIANIIVREMNDGKFAVFHDGKFVCASIHPDYVTYNVRRGRHAFIKKMTDNFAKPLVAHTIYQNGTHEFETAIKGIHKQKPVSFTVAQFVTVETISPVCEEEIVSAAADVVCCPNCGSSEHKKNGKHKKTGQQMYRCKSCNKSF